MRDVLDRLADLLVAHQHCDARTIERGRRVADESGQRLDAVLIQLGLVSERGLAEAYAALLDAALVAPEDYPAEALLTERLAAKFLRNVRVVPLALEADALVLAAADPLDPFAAAACAAATGRRVTLRVAVPIELEAALGRLYPDGPRRRYAGGVRRTAGGRRRTAEGPGQRGAGDPPGEPDHRPRG